MGAQEDSFDYDSEGEDRVDVDDVRVVVHSESKLKRLDLLLVHRRLGDSGDKC